MPHALTCSVDAPVRGNRRGGQVDERAILPLFVRDRQRSAGERASIPQDDVQIQRAWAPPLSAAATKGAFDGFQAVEQLLRRQFSSNDQSAVGIAAARWANGRALDHG